MLTVGGGDNGDGHDSSCHCLKPPGEVDAMSWEHILENTVEGFSILNAEDSGEIFSVRYHYIQIKDV